MDLVIARSYLMELLLIGECVSIRQGAHGDSAKLSSCILFVKGFWHGEQRSAGA